MPLWQRYRPDFALTVRTTGDPTPMMSSVHAIVRELLPELPTPRIRPLEELVDVSVAARRFQLDVVLLFAAAALLLAAMGVYGVVAQSIARRTREIGVRIALGAARWDVWRLVAREGLLPVGAGLAAGLTAGAIASRLVGTMLFNVRPFDFTTYAIVVGVMLLSAIAACAMPARRASRIDPFIAIRES